MAITIQDFFRFGNSYPQLLAALFDETDALDDIQLRALIGRHVDPGAPSHDTIKAQLLTYGVLEQAPYADSAYELRGEVRDLLGWILKRQELATADVIRGYLGQLARLMKEVRAAMSAPDWPATLQAMKELDRTLEKIRTHARSNFDSIATSVQTLQSERKGMTPRARFQVINRIWEQVLAPLRDLIDDRGSIEQRFDRLTLMLNELAAGEAAPAAVRRHATNTRARLVRTRRALSHCHDRAVREVEPLYKELRADSMLLEGASRLLKTLRQHGKSALELDKNLALEGWRPRGLISDDLLEARIAALQGYAPQHDAMLAEPPVAIVYHPLSRDEVRSALTQACPIEDVFDFVLAQWPTHSLSDQLRVFGWIHRGDFGPSDRLDMPSSAGESGEREYLAGATTICAWPVALKRVIL